MIPRVYTRKSVSRLIHYAMSEGKRKAEKELEAQQHRAEVIGGQGLKYEITRETLEQARQDMEENGQLRDLSRPGPKRENHALHLSLSWAKHEHPDNDHMAETGRSALKRLGMDRALAVFIRHHDTDHPHMHAIASRADPETGKTFSNHKDRYKLQGWALEYEAKYGRVREARSKRVLEYVAERQAKLEAHRAQKEASVTEHAAQKEAAVAEHAAQKEAATAPEPGNPMRGLLRIPNPAAKHIMRFFSDDESHLGTDEELIRGRHLTRLRQYENEQTREEVQKEAAEDVHREPTPVRDRIAAAVSGENDRAAHRDESRAIEQAAQYEPEAMKKARKAEHEAEHAAEPGP